eukprot:6205057-Pleurochrysis_carterae.AAC.2
MRRLTLQQRLGCESSQPRRACSHSTEKLPSALLLSTAVAASSFAASLRPDDRAHQSSTH